MADQTLQATPTFDWFITNPSFPRVQAYYEPTPGSAISETFSSSNLTVPEGSFLILMCAAFYNVTWGPGRVNRESDPHICGGLIQIPREQRPSTECLVFNSVELTDSGVFTCSQTPQFGPSLVTSQQTGPSLVTKIELRVAPRQSPDYLQVVKQSFDNVFTLTPRPVILTVEYEIGPACNGTCRGNWYLLPDTILDGKYDDAFKKVNASSEQASYSYVENFNLTPTRRLSRLVIPRTCYQNTGFYQFLLPNVTAPPVIFNVKIEFAPSRQINHEDIDGKQVQYYARLFRDVEYDISCSTPDFGPAENKTVRLEFYQSMDPQFCSSNHSYSKSDEPFGGYVREVGAFKNVTPMCVPPGSPPIEKKIGSYFSTFTIRAKVPGKIRCIVNWTYTDENNVIKTNGSMTELHYKIVDRPDFLSISTNLLIERSPKTALIGDPLTISCVAPTCQFDKIVLEKESRQVVFSDDYGIIGNNFDGAEVTFENTSMHVIVSVTIPETTKLSGGKFSCIGSDHGVPSPGRAELDVDMIPPSPPSFGRSNYTDKVLLKTGTQAFLPCETMGGLPRPETTWLYNGAPLMPEDGVLSDDNDTLTAHKVGRYECQVANKHGKVERVFNVVNEDEEKRASVVQIVVGTACAILLLLALCLAVWLVRRWRLASLKKLHTLMLKPPQQTLPLESFMPVNDQIESLPYEDKYELDKSKFTMYEVLGSGEYGKVYKGTMQTRNGDQYVAVKVPRDGLNVEHHKALISELKIMIYVRQHVNVLRVLGACTKDIQNAGFYILTEYCDRGSLRDFLIKNRDKPCSTCDGTTLSGDKGAQYARNIQMFKDEGVLASEPVKHCYVNVQEGHQCSYFSVETLLSYAYQSASGMEYLAAKNVVHRDLALRNLLLDGDVVKIADFGLSRHHYRDVYKSRKYDSPLPVFWMALESILSYKYTEKSDVWSFGVVLWELFSLGDSPYPGKRPDHEFVSWLREGNRMDTPKLAPAETYNLMMSCWNKDPDTRPTFSECKRFLGQHLDSYFRDGYRALLLTLASAKAACDEVQSSVESKRESSEEGLTKYAMFGGSETIKSSSASQESSDVDVTVDTSCGSLSSSGSDKCSVTTNENTCEPNLYQAPIISAPV